MTTENENHSTGQNNHDSSNKAAAQNDTTGIHKPAGADKPAANYKILGGNLLVFALYTLTALSTGTDGGVAALCLAGIQFIICTILAIAYKRSVWFLSAVLVLIIGFGTCVSTFTLGDMR
jgi:hypothetical protein